MMRGPMEDRVADTIPKRLFEQAVQRPEQAAYHVKENGLWRATGWEAYAKEVMQAARALVSLGFQPGDRVCILGFNRPEWTILDLAAMAAGGACAGIYTTCSPEEVQYIVHHAGAHLILVENEAQASKVAAQRAHLPALLHVVGMRGPRVAGVMSWEDFLARGEATPASEVRARIEALEPSGLATLIYTSGTTGPPKAVMLSHENLAWTAKQLCEVTEMAPGGRGLSYLPLSHIAEQMTSIHGPVTSGGGVYFAESIDKVPENLKEVRPTIFFGVPRIWEKFHAAIAGKMKTATGNKARLLAWARKVGAEVSAQRNAGKEPGTLLAAQHRLASRLVFTPLKHLIGLDHALVMVSGAAPIAREIIEFFASLDLRVQEIYGQSEDSGPTTFNLKDATRFGTVGVPMRGVKVVIAQDGEILVKGPNVFLGYYADEEATRQALDADGFLHSGDLGAFDAQGFLTITGRKKDILITAGGKNITPKNIESAVKNHPLVGEAVLIGDRRKYLTMLVTLDPDAAAAWMSERGLSSSPPAEPSIRQAIQGQIDAVNEKLARVEQVKKFTVLPRAFGIETGELTPTLKVKRSVVNQNFAAEIEAMYEGAQD